jgi:serine/threonine protein kinase
MMLTAGTRLGPYEILTPLGEGGMGVVYKANDTRLGRTVALKFVKAEFNQRWEREARAIAALNHPHIATLYDVGDHEGSPYLAMEYVQGAPLKGPYPVKELIEYGIQMADALAAAHAAGIVHRDLKPGNILVTEKGSVKVLDFGLAKLAEKSVDGATAATQTMAIAGTPGYIAPEQLNGKPADARSDIFAFGCILYELVSGIRAFPGETMGAALASTALAEPKPLESAPAALEELIGRCAGDAGGSPLWRGARRPAGGTRRRDSRAVPSRRPWLDRRGAGEHRRGFLRCPLLTPEARGTAGDALHDRDAGEDRALDNRQRPSARFGFSERETHRLQRHRGRQQVPNLGAHARHAGVAGASRNGGRNTGVLVAR